MTTTKPLDLSVMDKNAYTPDTSLIGQQLLHTGNQKTYTITDFAWLGATDEWGFVHNEAEGVAIVRPVSHLTGQRANGADRYVWITRAKIDAMLDELVFVNMPKPNQWCKIVCRKDGEPVLVTRDWDGDDEVEVVRLELRKKFSLTITLKFGGERDTALADEAFAKITADNIDTVLQTRGVDSLVAVVDGAEGG